MTWDEGLDSLVLDLEETSVSAEIKLDEIKADENQPRKVFDDEALEELAESIKAQGVVQPIILRDAPQGQGYIIIAGERRWRAAQIAELDSIPSIIRVYEDDQVLAVQIIENIDRTGFVLADEVKAVGELVKAYKTAKLAGNAIAKNKTWIAKRLAIYKSKPELMAFLEDGLTGDLEGSYQLSVLLKKHPKEGISFIDQLRQSTENRANFRQKVMAKYEQLQNPAPELVIEAIPKEEQANEKVSHEKPSPTDKKDKVAEIENKEARKPVKGSVETVIEATQGSEKESTLQIEDMRKKLSNHEFNKAVYEIRTLSERPKQAAYRVLVDGVYPSDVGKELDISQQAVSNSAKRVLEAWHKLSGGKLGSLASSYVDSIKKTMLEKGYPEDWEPVMTILPPDVAKLVKSMEKTQLEKYGINLDTKV